METFKELKDIAQSLNLTNISETISYLENRLAQKNSELIFPLVGEYSSGKTTLLNSLTNGKKLEAAILPTTATIFEIHFSNLEEKAVIIKEDGTFYEENNISCLKNQELADVKMVKVYDSSLKIPSSTIIVDTPGLSSLDPRHKKALVNYLPLADGIFLVVDVNQGVTSSVLKFIDLFNITKKRIYLVISMCDTKPQSEVVNIKKYILQNTEVDFKDIACVSAANGDIKEFLDLVDKIQDEKNKIVEEVIKLQLNMIRSQILQFVNELLNSSKLSTKELDWKILECKQDLRKIKNTIQCLIEDLEIKINRRKIENIQNFNQQIYNRLDDIAKNPSNVDINAITQSTVESISNLYFSNFKSNVMDDLKYIVKENHNCGKKLSLPILNNLDLSEYSIGNLSYNIDLNLPELQTLNNNIAIGVKIAGAIAAVATTAYLGGVGGSTFVGGKAIETADLVTDVASMASNHKHFKKIEKVVGGLKHVTNRIDKINQYESQIEQYIPMQTKSQTGLAGLVGLVTERTMGKPQRKKLIDNYIYGTLEPEFCSQMDKISSVIVSSISDTLYVEAEAQISQKEKALKELIEKKDSENEQYFTKVEKLKEFQNILSGKL